MTRYLCIFLIALIAPNYSIAQSISIDSSTVKNANYYLIKGAKARELNLIYQKRIATDSTLIELQDSIISDLEFVICEIDQDQKKIKKYSWYVTIYSIIVTLFLLK
jgi:hypothetical protein